MAPEAADLGMLFITRNKNNVVLAGIFLDDFVDFINEIAESMKGEKE